jgi:hypothetical protein
LNLIHFVGDASPKGTKKSKKIDAITDKIPKELFRFCGFRPEVEMGLGQTQDQAEDMDFGVVQGLRSS